MTVVQALRSTEAALVSEVARQVLAGVRPGDDPWAPLVDGGWIGVGIEETKGGQGGSIVEAAALVEAVGRTAAAVPLLEALLAAQLIAATSDGEELLGRMVTGGVRATLVPALVRAQARGGGYLLSDGQWITPWASDAELILIVARTAEDVRVVLLPRDRFRVERGCNLAREPRDRIALVEPVVAGEATRPLVAGLDDLLATTALLSAARLTGALGATQELTLRHAQGRRQFGRPIGGFQAVAHALARQAGDVELAAAALDASLAKARGPFARTAALTARVAAGAAAWDVARVAHQVHGAIGVTREYELHRFTMRLQAWAQELGTTGWWQRRLGREAVAAGSSWWDRSAPEA